MYRSNTYRLTELNEIGEELCVVDDTHEIIQLFQPDAVYDNADGWNKCLKEGREYSLQESELFDRNHSHLFNVNDFSIYKCNAEVKRGDVMHCFFMDGFGFCLTKKEVYNMQKEDECKKFFAEHEYVFSKVHPKPAGCVQYYECKVVL